jgi:hypothetical protein
MRRSIRIIAMASTLCAGCATTSAGNGSSRQYKVDELIDLPADGIAPVSIKAGPVEVIEVRIRNMPTEQDVVEDKRGTDRSHPKPTVVARSTSRQPAWLSLVSILEDEAGKPLMTCDARKDQELAPGATDDWNTCMFEGIRTREWPRVKIFHLIATVRVSEEAPSPAP